MEIFKLFGSVLVDNDEANRSIGKTGKEADGLGKKLGRGIKTAGKWALGIATATIAVGTAMFAMTKKVTNSFDNIAKSSDKLGVSTDAYQEMDYWASQNGLSSENMEKAVGRLNQRIGDAKNGNEKYSGALEKLGVNMDDVRDGTVSTEDAMYQSIQSLSEMTNEQDKAALASELFGTKLGRELMPALQDGSLSLEDAKKKAEELGIVIEEDTLRAAEDFNDTWDDLTRTFQAFAQKIIAKLMPAFQAMMDWIMEHMPQIQAVFDVVFDAIGLAFNFVTDAVKSLIDWFSQWGQSNEETLSMIWEIWQNYLGFLLDYWNLIWETIKETFTQFVEFIMPYITEFLENLRLFWEENGQQLMESALNTFNTIKDTVMVVFDAIWNIIQEILGLVVPFVQEQLKKLFAFWDEHGEKIMKAVDNAFKFIKGVIDFVMPVITEIIKGAWSIIQTVFGTAIDIILGLVDFFASLLTGDFEGMKTSAVKIFKALWEGVKGTVSGAWSLLSGAFSALWTSISGWFTGLKGDAIDWGKNMIDGFIEGMKGMGQKVADAAGDVVKKAGEFLKFWSPAKKGEGRYIRHWGRNMIDGFLDGVRDEEDEAGLAMENIVKKMNPGTLNVDAMANVGRRGVTRKSNNMGESNGTTIRNENNITIQATIRNDGDIDKLTTKLDEKLNGLGSRREAAFGG